MSKALEFAVRFAIFSSEMGIPPPDLSRMIAAAAASKRAYEKGNLESRHAATVEQIATEYGCVVDWPGLWPCVQKAGQPRTNQTLPSL